MGSLWITNLWSSVSNEWHSQRITPILQSIPHKIYTIDTKILKRTLSFLTAIFVISSDIQYIWIPLLTNSTTVATSVNAKYITWVQKYIVCQYENIIIPRNNNIFPVQKIVLSTKICWNTRINQFHNHAHYVQAVCLVGHTSCKRGRLYEWVKTYISFKMYYNSGTAERGVGPGGTWPPIFLKL